MCPMSTSIKVRLKTHNFSYYFQVSTELTLIEKTENKCYDGYKLSIRCETDIPGALTIASPQSTTLTTPICTLTDPSNKAYTLIECEQSQYVELEVFPSDYTIHDGEWSCSWDGGQEKSELDVKTGEVKITQKREGDRKGEDVGGLTCKDVPSATFFI